MFSKQHYEILAKLIKESDAQTKYELAQDLAKLFSEDNPRFNTTRFFKAVGLLINQTETLNQYDHEAKTAYAKLGVS
jgi:hypothetical protein